MRRGMRRTAAGAPMRWRGQKPRLRHLIHAAREGSRCLEHRRAQLPRGEAAYELFRLFDKDQGVLWTLAGKQHNWRTIGDRVEEGIGSEIDLPFAAHRDDPANWTWCDDGLDGIVSKAVIVLRGLVKHKAHSEIGRMLSFG
jgi:hypothetical protein